MDQSLVETNENEEKSSVSIGNGRMVSMQVLQDIYNEITGKTEKISKNYRLNHQVNFDDLEQLNIKIHQLYEQYHIVENNCNVTLYHIDDCKEVYSSFERFRAYDQTSLSPVENIRLEYNFLILLPKTSRAQNYTIEINIQSRAAIKQKAEKTHGMSKRIMHIFATKTAQLEIEYIDYTVARNFQIAIDGWFNALDQNETGKLLGYIQDYTHNFSFIFRYATALFLCVYFFIEFPSWLKTSLTFESQLKLAVLFFGAVYVFSGVASRLGTAVARATDSVQAVSCLQLNRGDERAMSNLRKSNNRNYVKVAFSFLMAIGINIFSTWFAKALGVGM